MNTKYLAHFLDKTRLFNHWNKWNNLQQRAMKDWLWLKSLALCWSWWYTPFILDLWRLRLEDWAWSQPKLHSQTVSFKSRNVTSKMAMSNSAQDLLPQNSEPGCMLRRQCFRCFCFLFFSSFLTNRNPSLTFPNLPSSEQVIKPGKDFPTFFETGHSAGTRGALPVLRGKNWHLRRWDRRGSSCVPQFIVFTSHSICPTKRFHNWTLSLKPPIFKKIQLKPVIVEAYRRLDQKENKLEVSLGCDVRSILKRKTETKPNEKPIKIICFLHISVSYVT